MVTKGDAITNAPLAGASFRVFDKKDPKTTVATLTTNAGGSDQTSLAVGPTYCLEETAVPQGYQLAPNYTPAMGCVALDPSNPTTIAVTDPPAPTPSASPTPTPSPAPTPTPSPTAGPTGELRIVKTDAAGQTITAPGFTFDLHVDSASGTVVAATTTDTTGAAIAASLTPATYCLEETAAPDGYQVAPTYTPGACVTVPADPTKGSNPTIVTVTDPASPSPSTNAASSGATRPPPAPNHLAQAHHGPPLAAGLSLDWFAAALVAVGTLLVISGLVMIAVDVNRRHRLGFGMR